MTKPFFKYFVLRASMFSPFAICELGICENKTDAIFEPDL
jgi:hypothetical protein